MAPTASSRANRRELIRARLLARAATIANAPPSTRPAAVIQYSASPKPESQSGLTNPTITAQAADHDGREDASQDRRDERRERRTVRPARTGRAEDASSAAIAASTARPRARPCRSGRFEAAAEHAVERPSACDALHSGSVRSDLDGGTGAEAQCEITPCPGSRRLVAIAGARCRAPITAASDAAQDDRGEQLERDELSVAVRADDRELVVERGRQERERRPITTAQAGASRSDARRIAKQVGERYAEGEEPERRQALLVGLEAREVRTDDRAAGR